MKDYRPGQGDGILIIVSINVSSIRTSKSFISLVQDYYSVPLTQPKPTAPRLGQFIYLFIYYFAQNSQCTSVPNKQEQQGQKALIADL